MDTRTSLRAVSIWGLMIAALLPVSAACGQGPAERPLRMGFMAASFFDVDPRDARIATEAWLGQVAESMDKRLDPQALVFSDSEAVVEALQTGALEVMGLGILDYLAFRDRAPLEASLVLASAGETVLEEYVLLVHRDRMPDSLAQLRGTRIRIGAWQGGLVRMWLDVLLGREGLPRSQAFFGSVEREERAVQTILPVFFKQVDACIVERRTLAAMIELNPQIGEDLVVWARLPHILPGVICFSEGCDPDLRASVRDGGLQLHTAPEGRQVLTLYRSERIVPFEPDHLRGVLALVAEHERLWGGGRTGETDGAPAGGAK